MHSKEERQMLRTERCSGCWPQAPVPCCCRRWWWSAGPGARRSTRRQSSGCAWHPSASTPPVAANWRTACNHRHTTDHLHLSSTDHLHLSSIDHLSAFHWPSLSSTDHLCQPSTDHLCLPLHRYMEWFKWMTLFFDFCLTNAQGMMRQFELHLSSSSSLAQW